MQEEITQKTLLLIINTPKLTFRLLAKVVKAYLRHRKEVARYGPVPKHGKQSLRRLQKQRQPLMSVDISGSYKRDFNRIMRKYGIDYAIKVDPGSPDSEQQTKQYLVFFKARENDTFTLAFQEFADLTDTKNRKPSIQARLRGTEQDREMEQSIEQPERAEQDRAERQDPAETRAPGQQSKPDRQPQKADKDQPAGKGQPSEEQKKRKQRKRVREVKKEAITR